MSTKQKLVVLSGAGISAESGLQTFRDSDGLWHNHKVEEVATLEAFERNPELVLDFYNHRRRTLEEVQPNNAHLVLQKLETFFDVHIITQNVDNLHERAGSSKILHLHGELTKAQSSGLDNSPFDIGYRDIKLGETCPKGFQIRPFIVWFGEPVPKILEAQAIVEKADILLIIGTSLNVYPAAGLVQYFQGDAVYLIDNKEVHISFPGVKIIQKNASEGINEFYRLLTNSNT